MYLLSLILIKYPVARSNKSDHAKGADGQQEYPGHCRSIAHMQIPKALLINVEGIEQRGVQWTARPAAHHVGGSKRLESSNHLQNEIKEDQWCKHGQSNGEEAAHAARAIGRGSFIVF